MFCVLSIINSSHLHLRDYHRSVGEYIGLLGYDDVPTDSDDRRSMFLRKFGDCTGVHGVTFWKTWIFTLKAFDSVHNFSLSVQNELKITWSSIQSLSYFSKNGFTHIQYCHCINWASRCKCIFIGVGKDFPQYRTAAIDRFDWLTLILLTWKIWWAPNYVSRWQIGFTLWRRNYFFFNFSTFCT